MPRKRQAKALRGSQRWIQFAVQHCRRVLDRAIAGALGLDDDAPLDWRSPRHDDRIPFAEYSDQEALDLLEVSTPFRPLKGFWPRGGPVWDALALTRSRKPIFIEAKAHIPELVSSPSAAKGRSLALIRQSL